MKNFSFLERIQSFKYAFQGILQLFRNEHNAWIHGVAAISAIGLGLFLGLSRMEWIVVILCIGIVLAAEAFNTAIEQLADFVESEQNEKIGHIKDLAASAVFLVAISALLVGLIIFLPKFINLLKG